MFKNKRPGLGAVARCATFVEPGHGKPAGGLEYVATVRVMALHAVHAVLYDRVMLGQSKFGMNLQVALKAGFRIFSWINDEFSSAPTRFDMFAAGAVAGLATGLPR